MTTNASNCAPSSIPQGASGIPMGGNPFLKKVVAVVVFVVANIFLNIPRYLLMGFAVPCMVCVCQLLEPSKGGDHDIVPIARWGLREYTCAALAVGLFGVPALPYIALLMTAIDDKIEWVAEEYPAQLWNGT